MKIKKLIYQIAVYCVGLLILAFGVAFAINSNLGISPVNSVPYVVHLVSGINMGMLVTLFFLLLIVMQIILLRRNFKPIDLTQIIFSTIFGYFVNVARAIVGDFTIPTYAGQLLMLAISIVLIAIGVSMYLEAKLISLPAEGIILAIIQKYPRHTFAKVKVIFDCVLVVLAVGITLMFLGGIYGTREGTILSAIFLGKTIPYARKLVIWILNKIE